MTLNDTHRPKTQGVCVTWHNPVCLCYCSITLRPGGTGHLLVSVHEEEASDFGLTREDWQVL